MKLIGIDIGSSFVKGAVLDLDRLCLARTARAPFPPPIAGLQAGHFEVDPRLAADAVRDTIVELLGAAPDCAGIVFCSQMGGLVLADRQGEPLTNYLSWRDQRTVLKAPSRGDCSYARMLKRLGTDRLNELGQDVKAGAMLSLLFWLREQGRLSEGSIPLGLGEFIVSRLCGAAPATEPTSALGLLDLQSGDWHRRAFAAIGLSGLEWPRLAQISQIVGEFTYRGRSIPCYPAVGDHQAALAGSLLEAGELSINVS
ncbi:MAG TPA: FGGY family carbohydrate kinase, partial [Planctomycetaceae bacterium]|nr:FGGY family carbohydrate kinase [Planctomycetaceae bacterium]